MTASEPINFLFTARDIFPDTAFVSLPRLPVQTDELNICDLSARNGLRLPVRREVATRRRRKRMDRRGLRDRRAFK